MKLFENMSQSVSWNRTMEPNPLLTDNLLVTAGGIMLFENIVSIFLLSICSRLNFQIRIFSINLAVSDLLTGFCLALPNTLLLERYNCDVKKYPCFLFINVSLLIISMMSLDRCFAFVFAMRYYSFISKTNVTIVCMGVWIAGFLLTYGMFFTHNTVLGLTCNVVVLVERNAVNISFRGVLLSIIVSNLVIFCYLLYHIQKRLRKICAKNFLKQNSLFSKDQSKVVRKMSVFIGVFITGYLPFMTIYTLPIDLNTEPWKRIYIAFIVLILLNSACNPVFYVWRFSEPRYHMKRLLCFCNKALMEKLEQDFRKAHATYQIYYTQSQMHQDQRKAAPNKNEIAKNEKNILELGRNQSVQNRN